MYVCMYGHVTRTRHVVFPYVRAQYHMTLKRSFPLLGKLHNILHVFFLTETKRRLSVTFTGANATRTITILHDTWRSGSLESSSFHPASSFPPSPSSFCGRSSSSSHNTHSHMGCSRSVYVVHAPDRLPTRCHISGGLDHKGAFWRRRNEIFIRELLPWLWLLLLQAGE
jgi:hypothetical protein